jgi:hypothetical protein
LKPLVSGEPLPIEQVIVPTVIESASIVLIGPTAAATVVVTFVAFEVVLVPLVETDDELETDDALETEDELETEPVLDEWADGMTAVPGLVARIAFITPPRQVMVARSPMAKERTMVDMYGLMRHDTLRCPLTTIRLCASCVIVPTAVVRVAGTAPALPATRMATTTVTTAVTTVARPIS